MDRDDLIERAARVIWDHDNSDRDLGWRDMAWADMGGSEPFDERVEYEMRARALADAGMLADPETVERMGGTILAVEVALAKYDLGGDVDKPLPERIESLAGAYQDVWRWWEKDQKDHERLREVKAERDTLAKHIERLGDGIRSQSRRADEASKQMLDYLARLLAVYRVLREPFDTLDVEADDGTVERVEVVRVTDVRRALDGSPVASVLYDEITETRAEWEKEDSDGS